MFVHARAPARIGIAGGGSDLPVWTRERPGLCLSIAIRSYTRAVAITRPDKQVVAAYSGHLDRAACVTEIANGLIRESALLYGWEDSFEVHTLSEIPSAGSGLGVSSSIAVALSAVFFEMARLAGRGVRLRALGEQPDPETLFRQNVAESAWGVEIDRLRRPIGRQDHMAAAHGGLRLYAFEGDCARVERTFSDDDARWLAAHLTLVRLPEGHDSRAILSNVSAAAQVQASFDAVPIAVRAIETRDVRLLGSALAICHEAKRGIAGAVTDAVDRVVTKIESVRGARCKVAGAGGGGHVVVAIEPESRASLCSALGGLCVLEVQADPGGVMSEGTS